MAYETTAVPIERSKEAIRKLLIVAGVRGVQFTEEFDSGAINIKFAKEVDGNLRTVSITLQVPEPEQPKRRRRMRNGQYRANTDLREQSTKATYRALHYWLKSQFEAVEFGLLSYEDVFLSHFEWLLENGQRTTVGKMVLPMLGGGENLLPGPRGDIIDV